MKKSRSETKPVPTKVSESSQNPLKCLVQLEALGKDVVANHDRHQRRRSEAPPGDVVHHSGMVPEGETQPDNPEQLVLLEVLESQ